MLGDWRAPQQCGTRPENQRPEPASRTSNKTTQSTRDIRNHPTTNTSRFESTAGTLENACTREFLTAFDRQRHKREPELVRKKQVQKVRAGWSGEWRATNGPKGVGLNTMQNRTRVWRKISQKRLDTRVNACLERNPSGGSHRRTTIVTLTAHCLDVPAAGAVVVHRLPHTAGMRQGSGNRQGRRGQCAHEQQDKQQSGGQAIHGWLRGSVL